MFSTRGCWHMTRLLTSVFIKVAVGYWASPNFKVPLLHHDLPAWFELSCYFPWRCIVVFDSLESLQFQPTPSKVIQEPVGQYNAFSTATSINAENIEAWPKQGNVHICRETANLWISSSGILSLSQTKIAAMAANSLPVGACLLCNLRHMLLTKARLVLSEYRLE